METQPVEQQIAGLEKAVKLFGILQFAGPLFMLVMATLLMAAFIDEDEEQLMLIITGCFCVAALLQLVVFRFVLLPQFRAQLSGLKGDNASSAQ